MFKVDFSADFLAEHSWLLCQAGFGVYMIILSVMDIKWKKVHFLFLISGGLFAIAGCFCGRETQWILLAAGGAAGILFMIISRATGESLGYGDSILIIIMGTFIGLWNLLVLLMSAFSMAAVFSAVMLLMNRFNRKSSFPFIPFLTAAYMGGMFIVIY